MTAPKLLMIFSAGSALFGLLPNNQVWIFMAIWFSLAAIYAKIEGKV